MQHFSSLKKWGNSGALRITVALLLAVSLLVSAALMAIDAVLFNTSFYLDLNSGKALSDPAGISAADYQVYYTALIGYFQRGELPEKTVRRADQSVPLFTQAEFAQLSRLQTRYSALSGWKWAAIAATFLCLIAALLLFEKSSRKSMLGIAGVAAAVLLLLEILLGVVLRITDPLTMQEALFPGGIAEGGLLSALWPSAALGRLSGAWATMAVLFSVVGVLIPTALFLRIGRKKTNLSDNYMYQS